MMRRVLAITLAALLVAAPALAKGGGHGGHNSSHGGSHSGSHSGSHAHSGKTSTTAAHHSPSTRSTTAARNSHGRIARSAEAKRQFEVQSGYPHGRRGYVVDHIRPLACGGADDPSNMQWQSVAEAKAKDKVERKGCR